MKKCLAYAAKTWGYYAVLMLMCVLFISSIENLLLQSVLNIVLLFVFFVLIFNDAAFNGEKACTTQAMVDRQIKQGRAVEESLLAGTFSRKTGYVMAAICLIPFLLVSALNLVISPSLQDLDAPAVAQVVQEEEEDPFAYTPAEETEEEAAPLNGVNILTRFVYMPYVFTFSLVTNRGLNILCMVYAFLPSAVALVGYLLGPKMRKKKLRDIALGKKRKARNLKVNKPQKDPKRPKAVV